MKSEARFDVIDGIRRLVLRRRDNSELEQMPVHPVTVGADLSEPPQITRMLETKDLLI